MDLGDYVACLPVAASVAVFLLGTLTRAGKFRDGIPTWAGIARGEKGERFCSAFSPVQYIQHPASTATAYNTLPETYILNTLSGIPEEIFPVVENVNVFLLTPGWTLFQVLPISADRNIPSG